MTGSDRQMDRDLGELCPLRPPRSVWPEVEKQLARRKRRLRRHALVRYGAPGLAASVLVATFGYVALRHEPAPDLSLQNTVENAVKDARAQASFSSLELEGGRRSLEALLVSAKPRRAEIGSPAATSAGQQTGAKSQNRNRINEF